jgi:antitoxin HicB
MSSAPFHLQLTATYEPAPEGGYIAGFEELPDVFSEGETLAEAKANLMDALELVLDFQREQSRKRPRHEPSTIRETFEFAVP